MNIQPFSNGTEFECWLSANCYECKKYYDVDDDGYSKCEIENALAYATITGYIDEPIALRMGMKNSESGWKYTSCKEKIPLQRWHVVGKMNGKKTLLFGPFESIYLAENALSSSKSIIEEVSLYSKINLTDIKLSIEQTNTQTAGEIDRFIEVLNNHQITDAFKWTAENNLNHLKSIEKRQRGSQWQYQGNDRIPWETLAKLPWKRLHKHEYNLNLHKDSCLYFYLDFNSQIGIQAFKLLSEFENYSKIKLEVGNHGMELVSNDINLIPTSKAWLIIGEAQNRNGIKYPDQLMVWTAYPGELTGSIENVPNFNGTFSCVIKAARNGFPIAVKKA